jgi:hypothetical protein
LSGGIAVRAPFAGICLCAAVLSLAHGNTQASAAGPEGGLDARAWEIASPPDKNGGEVEAPGAKGGAALQAAAAGGAVSFGSAASFGPAAGAAPVSQYLAGRGATAWSTENLTPPLFSGTYTGGAYQLFSADLTRGLLSSGWSCRDGGSGCAAENGPLAAGAPAGYRNIYLHEGGNYQPLITPGNAPALTVAPTDFELALEGATPDLHDVVFSTCAALTGEATEVSGASGCDPADPNLYLWSAGSLAAVNLLPGDSESSPGAQLAAPAGAISADGSRVYWRGGDGNLYLREGGEETVPVDADAGGGGAFQVASADGSVAYLTKGGHLYRFLAEAGTATDLTPSGGVQGVLGASADGSYVYYLAATGLFLWHGGTAAKVAATADAADYPPATGTARVSPDGAHLAFVSSVSLTGFDNDGKSEVFVYEAVPARLVCVSCNPKGNVPLGPSSIPAAVAAGGAPPLYKPRSLSADGSRLFFDSADALVLQDTDNARDVYEWQSKGTEGCVKAAGCIGLISSGRNGSDQFVDASADGSDAFFLTAVSLVGADPEGVDLYDARAGGGFPEAPPQIPCLGDDCQGPPPGPDDPAPPTSYLQVAANPPIRFAKPGKKKARKRHHHKKRSGKGRKRGGRR